MTVMAMAHLELVRGRVTDAEGKKLMAAVRRAMIDILRIPPDDPLVRLTAYERNGVLAPARMSEITVGITMFSGRSDETKKLLYADIARRFEILGIPTANLLVILHDVPQVNWGVGGVAATELDLDIELDGEFAEDR